MALRVTFAALLGLAALTGCGSDGAGGAGGDRLAGTAGLVQAFLEDELVGHKEGYADAGERLLAAALGGSVDGVTLSPPSAVRVGVVEADLDQDGTRETMLQVSLSLASPDPGPEDPVTASMTKGRPG